MPAEPSERRLNRRKSSRREEEYKVETGHSRELELKRSRGEVSCAECRRLKIKCSRNIPCDNCCKRGCSQLCPNGSLATGQGTRFVLAATEHLHRKIARYGARIRELEDALAQLQAKNSDEPHPLLHQPLLLGSDDANSPAAEPTVTNPPSLDVADALGTLTINEQGISRFFGPTGGSESLLARDLPFEPASSPPSSASSPPFSGRNSQSPLSAHPLFSQSFPLTPLGQPSEIRSCVESNLPTYDRAVELCTIYFEQVGWIFKGVRRAQVFDEMLPSIYSPKPEVIRVNEDQGEHRLALAFTMFAIAASVEPLPTSSKMENDGDKSTLAEHYHQLARAALCLRPILEKPSLITVQTLHLLSVLSGMGNNSDTQTGVEMCWSLGALACHLAQTIGLHRDASRWGLPAEEVQRRRFVFYDLFVGDIWGALSTGRPPTFSLVYIDCPYPQYDTLAPEDLSDAQMELWLFHFTTDVVAEVASKTLTPAPPSYQTVLELDKKVRDYPTIDKMDLPLKVTSDAHSATSSITRERMESFQQCVMEHMKETILLYIHRSYFAQSLIENPQNPLKSTYSSSFLAAYRSASTILKSVNAQFALAPRAVSVIPMMLVYVFSSAIVFGTIITRGPSSPLASGAMTELETACLLFSKASVHSARAKKALLILLQLREKAHTARMNAKKSTLADESKPVSLDEDDELSIFAGRTRFTSYVRSDITESEVMHMHSQARFDNSSPVGLQPQHSQTTVSHRPSLENLRYSTVPPAPPNLPLHSIIVPQPIVHQQAFIDDHTRTYTAHPDHFPHPSQSYQSLSYPTTPSNSTHHYPGQLPPLQYNDPDQQRFQPIPQPGEPGYYGNTQQYSDNRGWGPQSALEQRWGNFIHNSGVYDDNGYRPY